ncbi:unnamed protein product [Clonostachys byssicola]|uniref:Uncharacterized protein n=1 Tax=Clonostachys byssicola TaxID=160290 RepID=A0A9N9U633_9HYPO|nr:unnamed protein product [Clonostachys byssicola]
MAPIYRKALILGATSGIGEAFAAKLISQGTHVIVVGRREDRLDAFVQTHGSKKAISHAFDLSNLAAIPDFARTITRAHPDLDCVVVNAGIQRAFDFTAPEAVDLSQLDLEVTTNYTSAVHITTAFLPHLKTKDRAHLIFVSATLGLIPSLIRTPNYCASKAALHAFIMAVRQQLVEGGQGNVKLIEVFPPAVQTELHDTKHQPDLVDGGEMGMPLDQYTETMYERLQSGLDQFAIGPGEGLLKEGGWEDQRQKLFQEGNVTIQKSLSRFLKK